MVDDGKMSGSQGFVHNPNFYGHPYALTEDRYRGIYLRDSLPIVHVMEDYSSLSLSLKAHPVSFALEKLDLLHVTPMEMLDTMKDGMLITVQSAPRYRQGRTVYYG